MFSIQSKIGYIHKLLVDELKLNIMKTKIGKDEMKPKSHCYK